MVSPVPIWPWLTPQRTTGLDPGPGLGQGGWRLWPGPVRLPRHAEVRAQGVALGAQGGDAMPWGIDRRE